MKDITRHTVMFATLKCLNMLHEQYRIKFEEVLTNNSPEFGLKQSKQKQGHPFERMLMELSIKHRYCNPYRAQTNGKVERFWRTLQEDLIRETDFDSLEELKDELMQFCIIIIIKDRIRDIKGKTPADMCTKDNNSTEALSTNGET